MLERACLEEAEFVRKKQNLLIRTESLFELEFAKRKAELVLKRAELAIRNQSSLAEFIWSLLEESVPCLKGARIALRFGRASNSIARVNFHCFSATKFSLFH